MQETATKLLQSKLPIFLEKFSSEVVHAEETNGNFSVIIRSEKIREIIQFLKSSESGFDVLMDLFAVDYQTFEGTFENRFAVIYQLVALGTQNRIFLKVFLSEENPEIDSIHDIFAAANWFEREAWDLFGVVFRNHPNLVRILCHQDFVGHPLRKDYPSTQYQRLKGSATLTDL